MPGWRSPDRVAWSSRPGPPPTTPVACCRSPSKMTAPRRAASSSKPPTSGGSTRANPACRPGGSPSPLTANGSNRQHPRPHRRSSRSEARALHCRRRQPRRADQATIPGGRRHAAPAGGLAGLGHRDHERACCHPDGRHPGRDSHYRRSARQPAGQLPGVGPRKGMDP